MSLSIIVAMTEQLVIGNKGRIPWHISEDLRLFKKITSGNTVLMGRKTYDSLPDKYKPLPDRNNIVITKNIKINSDFRVDFCYCLEKGIELAKSYEKSIFIIGGASIYEQTLPLVEKLYISHIKDFYGGDAYFPNINLENWKINEEQNFDNFVFRVYERKI
ncbi:MAG: dihydrofolate reductase [Nanoarchaeota archaeon]